MVNQKIKFIENVEVIDHNGDVEFSAKAGDVKELPAPSCTRWIRRKKAVAYIGEPTAKQGKSKAEPKDTDGYGAKD